MGLLLKKDFIAAAIAPPEEMNGAEFTAKALEITGITTYGR